MLIKNATLFFIGIIILIFGVLVIIFDYPQIQYFENMQQESYSLLDSEKKSIHQRLIIEYTIGIGVSSLGISLLIVSFLKIFENRFR